MTKYSMDIAFILGSKIVELTLIVLMGYGLVKAKLLKSEDSKPLSIIGLYIISPAVMIEAFQISYTPEILEGLMLSFGMAVFLHGMLVIIGTVLKRTLKLDPIEHAASIYANSGNLIIPLVMGLFGKEWVVYASCFIIVQTFMFWTHCRLIIAGKGNLTLKTVLKNINIWSIMMGLVMFALQIKLPDTINGTLSSVGMFIGPNAMLIAGMLIASIPLQELFSSKRIYLVTFLRLLVIPLFLMVVVKLSGFSGWVQNGETIALIKIGRASCRERVCLYV